ncbi:hypothetical protein [Luteimonas kalidii]|uniref:Lipoprotein n=1 Tax=Luteimonas kalidii TaxID=3042025 RepID=A0ABT6JRP1_9GAMM|nr:hypothetical protein [Luteimonas kalidii]MDH5832816.1 hypothetical protein [Luteimonas kalidii]
MRHHALPKHRLSAISPGFLALLCIGLAGCVSPAERRQVNLQQDAGTCSDFGAEYGSPAYSECMLTQQRRRDVQQRESLEQTRLTTEIARDAQIMADRARKQRCDRDPDRRECKR